MYAHLRHSSAPAPAAAAAPAAPVAAAGMEDVRMSQKKTLAVAVYVAV